MGEYAPEGVKATGRPHGRPVAHFLKNPLFDVDTHRAGRPRDELVSRFEAACVEVGHFLFRDSADLGLSERAALLGTRLLRAFLNAERFEDEPRSRRGLEDEGEAPVVEYGEDDRDDGALLVLGRLVKFRDEVADVDAGGAERSTHRRRRRSAAAGDLELNLLYAFCHMNFVRGTLP